MDIIKLFIQRFIDMISSFIGYRTVTKHRLRNPALVYRASRKDLLIAIFPEDSPNETNPILFFMFW